MNERMALMSSSGWPVVILFIPALGCVGDTTAGLLFQYVIIAMAIHTIGNALISYQHYLEMLHCQRVQMLQRHALAGCQPSVCLICHCVVYTHVYPSTCIGWYFYISRAWGSLSMASCDCCITRYTNKCYVLHQMVDSATAIQVVVTPTQEFQWLNFAVNLSIALNGFCTVCLFWGELEAICVHKQFIQRNIY